jgi:hypothetical protein
MTAAPYDDRLIIVLGANRSGTTWLQRMLLSHPEIDGLDERETWLFHSLRALWNNLDQEHGLHELVDSDALAARVREFCDAVLEEHRRARAFTGTWYVERTPVQSLIADQIARVYPDAWYLHVIRDGRDVVRSALSLEFGTDEAQQVAHYWGEAVHRVRAAGATVERYREIRYEDLMSDAEGRVRELLTWFGLDAAPEDELRSRIGQRTSDFSSLRREGARKREAVDLHALDPDAGRLLVELGYAAAPSVSFWDTEWLRRLTRRRGGMR